MTTYQKFKQMVKAITCLVTVLSMLLTQLYTSALPERDIYDKAENAVRIMTFNVLSERLNENAMINRRGIVTHRQLRNIIRIHSAFRRRRWNGCCV